MVMIGNDEPLAVAAVRTLQEGDLDALRALLRDNPELAAARLGTDGPKGTRSLLHIVTDWPGHFANAAAAVTILVEAGADVNARCTGPHSETPLHWAASSDDVEVLDALLDAGADIEADGAVIGGGTALADATAFGQWGAARRLIERGAQATLFEAATLGLMDRIEQIVVAEPQPAQEMTSGLWGACHGGQLLAAQYFADHGADLDWVGWDDLTPLDVARRSDAHDVVRWLKTRGARSASELP